MPYAPTPTLCTNYQHNLAEAAAAPHQPSRSIATLGNPPGGWFLGMVQPPQWAGLCLDLALWVRQAGAPGRLEGMGVSPQLDVQSSSQAGQIEQQVEHLDSSVWAQQSWQQVHKLQDKRWAVPGQELQETPGRASHQQLAPGPPPPPTWVFPSSWEGPEGSSQLGKQHRVGSECWIQCGQHWDP